MNTIRYFIALVLVVSLPPLFLYWLLIHPLIKFWRAKGVGVTYTAILTIIAIAMLSLFSIRHELLATDFGTSVPLVAIGIFCLILAGAMRFAIQKHLSIKVLLGLPEIAPDRYPRTLVTDGIYARLRHPRYVQLLIALVGYALIANHLASYIIVALWLPAIYFIVALEEQELREHFGELYANYCRRVPRFIPRIGSRPERAR
ncbi:MAG TPA: isoprenylcysteine carboxylmethyltransferase family protein [Terriglobales bacterium]|nr:isoprenylcysteine carboxylmethyltransferase family protein [Terriglobales bacterium]